MPQTKPGWGDVTDETRRLVQKCVGGGLQPMKEHFDTALKDGVDLTAEQMLQDLLDQAHPDFVEATIERTCPICEMASSSFFAGYLFGRIETERRLEKDPLK